MVNEVETANGGKKVNLTLAEVGTGEEAKPASQMRGQAQFTLDTSSTAILTTQQVQLLGAKMVARALAAATEKPFRYNGIFVTVDPGSAELGQPQFYDSRSYI